MSWTRMKRGTGAALLLVLGACNQEGNLFETDRPSGQAGGGTTSPVVVGSWETTLIVNVDGDLQTWTTRWDFNAAGLTCRFNQVVESLVEGIPRIETRPCTWLTSNGFVSVTFTDNEEVLRMAFEFADFDPNRLVLDGTEYQRVEDVDL
jgi:hypothetical protein